MSATVHPTRYGTFEVKWRENGRQRSKTLKTEAAAIRFGENTDRRLEEGKPVVLRRDVPTLREFLIESFAKWDHLEESTLTHNLRLMRNHVFPQIGELNLLDCRPRRMEEWQTERLDAGAGRRAIGQTQSILSKAFTRAVRLELIDFNPMVGMAAPNYTRKEHRWLTANEVEKLRRWYLERDDLGSATLISLLGLVGPRPQDVLALEVGHVGDRLQVVQRLSNGKILSGSKTGRHKRRAVYLPDPVRADLENWLALRKTDGKLIFPRPKDGRPWTRSDYGNWRQRPPRKSGRQKCFKTAAIECGLGQDLTPYGLRHTAASIYIAAGWTVPEVAHQLGHSPAESMRTYQHVFEEALGREKVPVEDQINRARGLSRQPDTVKEEAR